MVSVRFRFRALVCFKVSAGFRSVTKHKAGILKNVNILCLKKNVLLLFPSHLSAKHYHISLWVRFSFSDPVPVFLLVVFVFRVRNATIK